MDILENACNTVINTLYKNPEVLGTEITNGIVFDLLYIRNNASSFKVKTKGEIMKILIGEFELELGDKIIIDTSDLTKEDIEQIEMVLVSTCSSYKVEGE